MIIYWNFNQIITTLKLLTLITLLNIHNIIIIHQSKIHQSKIHPISKLHILNYFTLNLSEKQSITMQYIQN